jgi:hypothetical protein
VGEIGRTPGELKYGLKWWEIRSIIRGYNRRHRDIWSSTRWQTFQLMGAQVGKKGMNEAGLFRPTDLIQFPWEKEASTPLSDEDRQQLQAEMDAYNKANSITPSGGGDNQGGGGGLEP